MKSQKDEKVKAKERKQYLTALRTQLDRPRGSFRYAARWLLGEVERLERELLKRKFQNRASAVHKRTER